MNFAITNSIQKQWMKDLGKWYVMEVTYKKYHALQYGSRFHNHDIKNKNHDIIIYVVHKSITETKQCEYMYYLCSFP